MQKPHFSRADLIVIEAWLYAHLESANNACETSINMYALTKSIPTYNQMTYWANVCKSIKQQLTDIEQRRKQLRRSESEVKIDLS